MQPAGADVLIDGERWRAPDGDDRLVVQVTDGRHHIEVRKEGYQPFTTEVDARGGESVPINISLPKGTIGNPIVFVEAAPVPTLAKSGSIRTMSTSKPWAALALAGFLSTMSLGAQQPAPPAQAFNVQEAIPFDSAVRTGTLPNGLKFFIRQNPRPAKRVLLRLAVKAGSLHETEDQQGLAHFLEHMAFNGSAHFKPGELVSYFERTGSRLGPHVNAYTSFDETVYMLELPTDSTEIVSNGLNALADFAGGLTLDPEQVDKERGVVIEEWRGRLGAGSRIGDKQLPVLYHQSRYAERLPIGKPEILRSAPASRLRAFYDTWYRPDQMAIVAVGDVDPQQLETAIRAAFEPMKARASASTPPDRSVPLHKDRWLASRRIPKSRNRQCS